MPLLRLVLSFAAGALLTALVLMNLPVSDRRAAEAASGLAGLRFEDQELDSLIPDLQEFRAGYGELRTDSFPNQLPYPLVFLPDGNAASASNAPDADPAWLKNRRGRPVPTDSLPFLSAAELSVQIRSRALSPVTLTRLYLDRLKRFDDTLLCTVTLFEKEAMEAAARAEAELAAGRWRGPLHGLPYGIKDLFSVPGAPTTWGSVAYRHQVLPETAAIVEKLDAAGAILLGKLTLGELAWGDVWFGGMTRNPWRVSTGSSGSSAGSAAATAAGLAAFTIGTETWGSIVSPAATCGVSGLRPTFGAVSRHGGMVLSWSMDKPGPIARSAEDLALVFDVIRGADVRDAATRPMTFTFSPGGLEGVRLGHAFDAYRRKGALALHDSLALGVFQGAGIPLQPVVFPDVPRGMDLILAAEAGAAFDELTRSNRDEALVRQIRNAWPNVLRASRFVPAVEYIQANRLRTRLIAQTDALFDSVDVVITPTYGGSQMLLTNLTGHPCVVVPAGFDREGMPVSVSFIGRRFGEAAVLRAAAWFQSQTDHHRQIPPGFL